MDMNEVRKIQLQQMAVLKQVIDILDKEGICYFAIGGTALGAIRHQGFIPWDDDIDLGMLRKDYDKFLTIQDLLPKNLVIYNFEKDKNFPLFFSKVYDMETPYYCHSNRKYAVPRNIFIDFFPWDNISNREKLQTKLNRINVKFKRLIFKSTGSLLDKAKFFMYKIAYGFKSSEDMYKQYHTTIKELGSPDSQTWGNVLFNDVLEYHDIFPLRQVKFEDIMINVPHNCEKYLELKYGDYMTPPPEEMRVNHSRR